MDLSKLKLELEQYRCVHVVAIRHFWLVELPGNIRKTDVKTVLEGK